ncbi:MAG TPA: ADP-ribosylglycohydrolase family protein, partial [Hyphomicrobiaceae bacterium]|nr:ADP-ribosylglycohydrolase family protein [Hyphomicrobiaceae bacterium]
GSVQGFTPQSALDANRSLRISNVEFEGARALAIDYTALGPGQTSAVNTPTFTPRDVLNMRTYELMATPLVYPGQVVKARVVADTANVGSVGVRLRARVYNEHDELRDVDGTTKVLAPGDEAVLQWQLPDLGGQPIAELGVALSAEGRRADGRILLDYLRWDGAPRLTLRRPPGDSDFWRRAWVNGVSFFSKRFPPSFRISQDRGEGLIIHGTRQWTDYRLDTDVVIHLGNYGGVSVRVQGLRRRYDVRLTRAGYLEIVRVRDDKVEVLASTPLAMEFERKITFSVAAKGPEIRAEVGGVQLTARDDGDRALVDGGIALLIAEGALSTDEVRVTAA